MADSPSSPPLSYEAPVASDMLELKNALLEKEMLLREVHHRVKNNLQIIRSLLNLQAASVKDPGVSTLFRETEDRVRCMGLIHEMLYQGQQDKGIDFNQYVQRLLEHIFHSYGAQSARLEPRIRMDEVMLDLDTAIPCGLIVNELVSNALKHAFDAGGAGWVQVELCSTPDGWKTLRVSDNGLGLPPGFDLRLAASLGLKLVAGLARQIGGTLEVHSEPPGAQFEVKFRRPKH